MNSETPKVTSYPPASFPTESVGIGMRSPYHEELLDTNLNIGWLEIHPENYFGGGRPRHFLRKLRGQHQISMHAVGLSLGSTQPVNKDHLSDFKALIDEFDPFLISDHVSWSASGNAHLNDLLPLPYTQESLDSLCRNIEQTQDFFGRRILVENPSSYVAFTHNEMTEYEFMNAIACKTGCGVLLDINNIFVQAHNHGYDAYEYLDYINPDIVGEMHLAGHTEKSVEGDQVILVDTHNQYIRDEVWALYEYAVRRLGAVPTLIEWDQDFPSLQDLVGEADKARTIQGRILGHKVPQQNLG